MAGSRQRRRRHDGRIGRFVGIEMFGQDGSAACGDHGAGQGIFQLPDVARPGTLLDGQQGLGRQRELAPAVRALDALQDVIGQRARYLRAVAERWDDDPGDIKAVIKVFAEPAGRDLFRQVAMCRRNDRWRRCEASRFRRRAQIHAAG